jgi:hypothetical protein
MLWLRPPGQAAPALPGKLELSGALEYARLIRKPNAFGHSTLQEPSRHASPAIWARRPATPVSRATPVSTAAGTCERSRARQTGDAVGLATQVPYGQAAARNPRGSQVLQARPIKFPTKGPYWQAARALQLFRSAESQPAGRGRGGRRVATGRNSAQSNCRSAIVEPSCTLEHASYSRRVCLPGARSPCCKILAGTQLLSASLPAPLFAFA